MKVTIPAAKQSVAAGRAKGLPKAKAIVAAYGKPKSVVTNNPVKGSR